MKKALTYEELIELAGKNYNNGGDGIYECWDQKTFNDYVEQYGPITEDSAMEMWRIRDELNREYAGWGDGPSEEEEIEEEEQIIGNPDGRYIVGYKNGSGFDVKVTAFDTYQEAEDFAGSNWMMWPDCDNGELRDLTIFDRKNIYGMENVKIKSQNRSTKLGNKKYEYFDVIADTERFGKQQIMFQGTFKECIAYLEENGIDYVKECIKFNHKHDVQITFRMYTITDATNEYYDLIGRDLFRFRLYFKDLKPIAPFTFKLPDNTYSSSKSATVKLMEARAW